MSNKQTHVISPELNMNAQFKQVDHIPTNHLQAGDVIQVLPGSYTDPRTTNVADVTIVGMGDAKDIIFAGYVEEKDLPCWYRSSNLYLHLAWIEPNANSQAEAIASGLPSLCANNGGNFELVIKSDFCLTAFSLDKSVSPLALSTFSINTSVSSPTSISDF